MEIPNLPPQPGAGAHETLEQRLATMKHEIDALQIANMRASRPWYQDMSTILSIVALLFSFGTTWVSARRADAQDIQSARQELRGLLQRMAALPKEGVEMMKKYADDPASQNLVGGFINQENTFLVRNAAELARKLPKDQVSATEYYAVGVALQLAYDLQGSMDFLGRGLAAKPDFNTKLALWRTVANTHFGLGRPEEGRAGYQKALEIFSEFPGYDLYTRISTQVSTELSWAISEANFVGRLLALPHVDAAEKLIEPLPASPGTDRLKSQIAQLRAQLHSGAPVVNPVPGAVVPLTPVTKSG